jgi:CBS domain-containing protein
MRRTQNGHIRNDARDASRPISSACCSGRLGRSALASEDEVSVEEAMANGPSTVRPSLELEQAIERMREQHLTTLPVTTSEGRLLGLLERDTAEEALGSRQEKLTPVGSQVILTSMAEPAEMVAQTASEDPEVGLRGVASLRALLEAVEELQVRRARELGWSWQQIAELLGVSKQAVHQKYAKGERRPRRRLR